MGTSRDWFVSVRKKFVRSPRTTTVIAIRTPIEEAIVPAASSFTKEDVAVIKIQAFFRGRLARRAFRALKSLVKLQALVRGVCVRRQTRIALHCMHSLVRLQVRVRARQLLTSNV